MSATTYTQAIAAFEAWCASMEMDSKDSELRHAFLAGIQYAESFHGIEEEGE